MTHTTSFLTLLGVTSREVAKEPPPASTPLPASVQKFAESMEHMKRHSGVSMETVRRFHAAFQPPSLSQMTWERRCRESLLRSRARRSERSPHPWPHGSEWLWVIFLLALFAAMVAAAWLLVPS
jgi:hypothetical protein